MSTSSRRMILPLRVFGSSGDVTTLADPAVVKRIDETMGKLASS
jgi:hypothetical protein